MSYINSALRKVQKERDSRYAAYGDFISSRRKGTSAPRAWRLFAVPAVVAGILGILAAVAWLVYPAATAKVKGAAPLSPQVAAEKRPTAGQAIPVVGQVLPATGPALPTAGQVSPTAGLPATGQAIPATGPALPTAGQTLPAAGQVAPGAAAGVNGALSRAAPVYEAALVAQRGKRWPEAERLYQQALAIDPRQVKAMNNLGVLYLNQKRSVEAMELFVKALAIQDNYVDPYYNLACLYSRLGNIKASLSYLERAVKIDGQVKKWAKQDNDFKKMHSLPEFTTITEELVK